MWKWIAGILSTIISGVAVYYLTEGRQIKSPNGSESVPPTGNGYSCFIAETSDECPTSSRDLFGECDCGNPNQTGIVIRYK